MTELPRLLQVTQNVSADVFQMVLEKSMTWWLVALSSELVPYHKNLQPMHRRPVQCDKAERGGQTI